MLYILHGFLLILTAISKNAISPIRKQPLIYLILRLRENWYSNLAYFDFQDGISLKRKCQSILEYGLYKALMFAVSLLGYSWLLSITFNCWFNCWLKYLSLYYSCYRRISNCPHIALRKGIISLSQLKFLTLGRM